jgi:hypothetical protein
MMPSRGLDTPETYLNPERASLLQKLQLGTADYVYNKGLTLNQFALNGTWTATKQYVTPAGSGATVRGDFQAQHVYLVLTSEGNRPRRVKLLLNGRPLTKHEQVVFAALAAHGRDGHPDGRGAPRRRRLRLHVRVAGRSHGLAAACAASDDGVVGLPNLHDETDHRVAVTQT